MTNEPLDGVIKFNFSHSPEPLEMDTLRELSAELMAWRAIMRSWSLIGQVRELYGGVGYGNVSARYRPFPGEIGERRFLITGTQTGGLACNTHEEYCLVEQYDTRKNYVRSRGLIEPSSETMTHGTIYDLDSRIRYVFHGHSRLIWPLAEELQIPYSSPDVPYGTPAMAEEVKRLYRTTTLADVQILAMGGHEDGIVAFGNSALDAGQVLLKYLALAYKKTAMRDRTLCG